MQFNLVNNKEMLVFLCMWVHDGTVCLLAVSSFRSTCTGSRKVMRSQCSGLFGTTLGRALWGLCFFFKRLFSALVLFLFFWFPPTTLPFFFSFHCYHSVTGAPMSLCGAHGWFGGIASLRSVLLPSGWLITVEALDIPGTHLPLSSMQLINVNVLLILCCYKFLPWGKCQKRKQY